MATKPSTIYSDNPKMDKSGITAKRPTYAFSGPSTETITGGKLYMEAIEQNTSKKAALTSNANLRKQAKLVEQGYGCGMAARVVAADNANPYEDD